MAIILTKKENSVFVEYEYDEKNYKLNHIMVHLVNNSYYSIYIENNNIIYKNKDVIIKFDKYGGATEFIELIRVSDPVYDSNGKIIGEKYVTLMHHPREVDFEMITYTKDLIKRYGGILAKQFFIEEEK